MKRHLLLALVLTYCMRPLQCVTLERLSLADMAGKSTSVERAKVVGSYAAFSGSIIYTHYKLQVGEQLKGQAVSEIVVPGGVANGVQQSYAGAPRLNPGDEFVFFLWTANTGLVKILGFTQGLFTVTADSTTDPSVVRTASQELMLDHKTGRPVKDETLVMRMSQLRSAIAGTAAAQ